MYILTRQMSLLVVRGRWMTYLATKHCKSASPTIEHSEMNVGSVISPIQIQALCTASSKRCFEQSDHKIDFCKSRNMSGEFCSSHHYVDKVNKQHLVMVISIFLNTTNFSQKATKEKAHELCTR